MISKLPTDFAPAERTSEKQILQQIQEILSAELLDNLFAGVLDAVVLLNEQRQIVFCNHVFLQMVNASCPEQVYGLRPGEAMGCLHAKESCGGCGTTVFCRECGALRAILKAQTGSADIQECRISSAQDGEALDLLVHATPVKIEGHNYTIVASRDISNEKRRRVLEHIFFHDVINTAITAQSASKLMLEDRRKDADKFRRIVSRLTDRLLEQIVSQRDLAAAENGELAVSRTAFDVCDLMREVIEAYHGQALAENKYLSIGSEESAIKLLSDRTLLGRVLENLVKNALEACGPESRVLLSACPQGDNLIFSVHNPGYMPEAVQHQIFQRSFSTKGQGRGIGTYSVKLISEKYLNGKVHFTSTEAEGTTFFAEFPLTPGTTVD